MVVYSAGKTDQTSVVHWAARLVAKMVSTKAGRKVDSMVVLMAYSRAVWTVQTWAVTMAESRAEETELQSGQSLVVRTAGMTGRPWAECLVEWMAA